MLAEADSTERDADYIDMLRQIVGSSEMDSEKSERLKAALSGEGLRGLALDTCIQVVACFVGEGKWNVDAQRFDGAPDWESVNARLLRVFQLVEARRGQRSGVPAAVSEDAFGQMARAMLGGLPEEIQNMIATL